MKIGDLVVAASADCALADCVKDDVDGVVVSRVYSWKWIKVALKDGSAMYVRSVEAKEA